ncbi:MAG: hypothetical protein JWQ92_1609, partial [Amnibacterium sp.]|nr:hypothetical protein [Amnibacterium sp.]
MDLERARRSLYAPGASREDVARYGALTGAAADADPAAAPPPAPAAAASLGAVE